MSATNVHISTVRCAIRTPGTLVSIELIRLRELNMPSTAGAC